MQQLLVLRGRNGYLSSRRTDQALLLQSADVPFYSTCVDPEKIADHFMGLLDFDRSSAVRRSGCGLKIVAVHEILCQIDF